MYRKLINKEIYNTVLGSDNVTNIIFFFNSITFFLEQVPKSAIYWPQPGETDATVRRNLFGSYGQAEECSASTSQVAHEFIAVEDHEEVCNVDQDHSDSSSKADSSSSSSSAEHGESSESSSEEHEDTATSSSECQSVTSERSEESNSSDEPDGGYIVQKVYEGCSLTKDEGVLQLMELFIKHKMEKGEVGDILKRLLKFIPKQNNMPKSQHTLFQYVENLSPVSKERVHFYCSECQHYLGEVDKVCPLCKGDSHKFYQLPLADQIKNLFENHGLADAIDKYSADRQAIASDDVVRDMCDGSETKRARVHGQYNLTLQGHTDGISVSKSSNASLWPLEYVIIELPPQLRFKFVLINGIWLDNCKPYLNTYFKPFMQEVRTINTEGIKWVHPRTKEVKTTYITVPSFCADAPARAQIQNILSHGGRHCCNICEQKMKKLPEQPIIPGVKRKRRRRVFTYRENPSKLRTADRMEAQGEQTRQDMKDRNSMKMKAVKGVRGKSIISSLPGCDRSTVVYPEYMHLILCLIKGFLTLWFEKPGPWSLKHHQDKINAFLEGIRVPDFVTRIPRSTEYFSKWKANEIRSFLLYYSVIILSECMEERYFQHWMLLVSALYILLQDSVSKTDIARADVMLNMFCREFADLYSNENYTYYVHNLLHLALSVERSGPAWNSAFQFESFNGTLAEFIHGSKHQGKELVNSVRLAFGVEILRLRCCPESNSAFSFAVEFRNRVKHFTFNDEEKSLLSACKLMTPIKIYYRAVIKREIFTSRIYQRQKRRNNFTICYVNSSGVKEFGQIKCFCESSDNQKLALVEPFSVDHLRVFSHSETNFVIKHIIPVIQTNRIDLIKLSAILFKVIRVSSFVVLRPNRHEVNL